MMNNHNYCTVAIGTVTEAIKAQRVLSSASIFADVVKVDRVRTKNGCIYGLSFPCPQESNVHFLLRASAIPIKEYERGQDGLS